MKQWLPNVNCPIPKSQSNLHLISFILRKLRCIRKICYRESKLLRHNTIPTLVNFQVLKRPIPSSPKPLFQSEAKCEDEFVYSHAIKAHFQKRGFAFSLVLTARVCGTRKWLICDVHFFAKINSNYVTTYYGEQILRQGHNHHCITFIPQD